MLRTFVLDIHTLESQECAVMMIVKEEAEDHDGSLSRQLSDQLAVAIKTGVAPSTITLHSSSTGHLLPVEVGLDQTNPSKFSRYYDTSSRNSL
jgi:hypothetical protein